MVGFGKITDLDGSNSLVSQTLGDDKAGNGNQYRHCSDHNGQHLMRLQFLKSMQPAGDQNANLPEVHFGGSR
jgi:hypothetical protein